MIHDQSDNPLPDPTGFSASESIRTTPDTLFTELISKPFGSIAQWIDQLILATPEIILETPSMARILAQSSVHHFTLDSVDTQVFTLTQGPDEVHISLYFHLGEKPALRGRRGKVIRGAATLVLMRNARLLFIVPFADVLHRNENN